MRDCTSLVLFGLTLALGMSACGSPRRTALGDIEVHAVRIDSTNIGVIHRRGQAVLVDVGLEGAWEKFLPELEALKVDVDDVDRMIITHGHGDHAGDIEAVQDAGIDVWLHADDEAAVAEGQNSDTEVIGLEAAVLDLFVTGPFPPSTPKLFAEDFVIPDLKVAVHHVGGHTAGSVVVLVDDKVAFVGDLLRGGNLGGLVAPEVPLVHYFHVDQDVSHQALRDLLDEHKDVHTIWPAHGGPFTRDQVDTWLTGIGF